MTDRPAATVGVVPGLLRQGIVALFFLNALLDRLAAHFLGLQAFTRAFYGLLGLAVVLRIVRVITSGRAPRLAGLAALFISFALAIGLTYGSPAASVYGVKQFFIGIVFLFVFSGSAFPIGSVLWCLLLVQCYALFQGAYYLTQGLTLPPWDAAFVEQQLETWGARNLFQGQFVRPFATFASFSEYQVVAHVTTAVLWLARAELRTAQRRATWVAMVALLTIDAMLPDRTGIMMAGIVLVISFLGSHLVSAIRLRPGRLVIGTALAVTVVASFYFVPMLFLDATNPGLRRLAEAFRVWEAETVRERAATAWAQSLQAIRFNPEGLGPFAVAAAINSDAIIPHNNYFLWAIGYSVIFPPAFMVFLIVAFWRVYTSTLSVSDAPSRLGYIGTGLTLAFLASSVFNATFTSYPGAAFFMLMLWLDQRVRTPDAADQLVEQ